MSIKIRNQLVPSKHAKHVTSSGRNPRRFITVHETGNRSRGAGAAAHANLQARGYRAASWHIQVDEKEAVRSFKDTVRCWHAGDGSGHGNMSSIGIEICVNSDGDYAGAKANAIKVIRQLRAKYDIPRSRVVQHNHWSGKNCPTLLRRAGWATFVAATDPQPKKKQVSTPARKVWPHTGLTSRAGRGTLDAAWTRLLGDVGYTGVLPRRKQRWLRDRGYYKGAMDNVLGPYWIDAFQRFLRDRGHYTGAMDAHRVPPSKSWGPVLRAAEASYLNDQRRYYR